MSSHVVSSYKVSLHVSYSVSISAATMPMLMVKSRLAFKMLSGSWKEHMEHMVLETQHEAFGTSSSQTKQYMQDHASGQCQQKLPTISSFGIWTSECTMYCKILPPNFQAMTSGDLLRLSEICRRNGDIEKSTSGRKLPNSASGNCTKMRPSRSWYGRVSH